MGRTLIIKDADFSAVAIEQDPAEEKFYLTRSNYFLKAERYINTQTEKWSLDAPDLYVYPISAGEVVYVKNYEYQFIGNIVLSIGAVGADVAFDQGESGKIQTSTFTGEGERLPILLKANSNGFFVVYGKNETVDYLPDDMFIMAAPENPRSLTRADAAYHSNYYMRSDGSWGGGVESLYFNIFAGDVIKVTAQSSRKTFCALVQYKNFQQNGVANLIAGESRRTINAGETSTFTAPYDCVLWVYGIDTEVDYFPASIIINS